MPGPQDAKPATSSRDIPQEVKDQAVAAVTPGDNEIKAQNMVEDNVTKLRNDSVVKNTMQAYGALVVREKQYAETLRNKYKDSPPVPGSEADGYKLKDDEVRVPTSAQVGGETKVVKSFGKLVQGPGRFAELDTPQGMEQRTFSTIREESATATSLLMSVVNSRVGELKLTTGSDGPYQEVSALMKEAEAKASTQSKDATQPPQPQQPTRAR